VVKEDEPVVAEETNHGTGKMVGDEMVMKEDEPVNKTEHEATFNYEGFSQ